MNEAFQKPSGIAYVTTKDVGRTDRSNGVQDRPQEYWSAARVRSLELDSLQCLMTAAEVVALSELPPAAAFAAVLGGHQCMINLIGDFVTSDKDNATLHQISNVLDPLGLQFAIIGGFFGQQGLIVGAEFGATISGAYGFAKTLGMGAEAIIREVKLGDDFSTLFEDTKKLLDEWQRRFGDQASDQAADKSQEDEGSEDSSEPDQGISPEAPSSDDQSDDDEFEPPAEGPNGDDDFFLD